MEPTINTLRKIKMTERLSNPTLATAAETILDIALKKAKANQVEATDQDAMDAVKKLAKEAEGDIKLIEDNGGDATKWKESLLLYRQFLPAQLSEEETLAEINRILSSLPEDQRTKKAQGLVMKELKKNNSVNMTIASGLLNKMLV